MISPGADWVYSYDPKTGRELWRAAFGKLGFSNVARPVIGHKVVYICTCFLQSSLLAIRLDGEGDITESHIAWRYDKQMPRLPSPVLVGDGQLMASPAVIDNAMLMRTDSHLDRIEESAESR